MKMWMVSLRKIDVRTSMLCAMAIVLLGVCPEIWAQESDARFNFPDPKPVMVPLEREVHMSELPPVAAGGQVRFMPAPRAPIGEQRLRLLKEHATSPSGITIEPGAAPSAPSSVEDTPTVGQAYFGEDEVSCGGFIPSDGGFSVNALYLVQVANSCISIRSATTGFHYSNTSLNSFFGFPANHVVGDPRTVYDWNANRFIVIAEDFSVCDTILGVAVSKTSNATDGWWVYKVDMGGFGDFPMLGQTLNELGDFFGGIYASWNLFGCTTNSFTNVVAIWGKTNAYNGTSLSGSAVTNITFGGVPLDTIQPVNVTGRGDRPRTEYLVSAANNDNPLPGLCGASTCSAFSVLSISHGISAGGPVFSGLAVGTFSYTIPGNARQRGATSGRCLIDTGDNRIGAEAYYQSGNIYFAHSVGTSVGSATHISQFQPILSTGNGAATITGGIKQNDFCFDCGGQGTNGSNYYGGIVPDPEGNFTMVYDFSDDNNFPGVAYLSDRVSFPRGSVPDPGFFLEGGSSTYCQLDNTGRNRWGDYTGPAPATLLPAGTALAPKGQPFWFWGQFSEANGNWGTAIGRNGYTSVDQVGY